jgi:hypothetical protein
MLKTTKSTDATSPQAVSATGVRPAPALLPSAREGHKAEIGATRVEATATLVAVAAGAAVAVVVLSLNLHLDLDLDLDLLQLLVVSATGAQMVLVLLPSAREEHKAENGATRVEATATPVAVAAGVPSALHLLRLNLIRLQLLMVSATGAQMVLALLPSAREEHKAENGATRVEATATPVAVAAGVPSAVPPLHLLRLNLIRLRLLPRTPSLAPAPEERAGVELAGTARASRWTAFLVMTMTSRCMGVEALSS